jgi:hypothetical protein
VASRSGLSRSPAFEALVGTTQFRDRIAVRVKASPDETFEALRTVTLHDMKLAWLLGELRYLPARLTGHQPHGNPAKPFFASCPLFGDRGVPSV